MKTSQLFYRTRQFWTAISSRFSQIDLELISTILSPAQLTLFKQMQVSEQAHSQMVLLKLISQGETDHDLLVAAILHDVGKSQTPLNVWERVMVVLVKAICPGCVRQWGQQPGEEKDGELGWRKAFIVSVNHPRWGAELAEQCDASPLAVELIARHKENINPLQGEGISEKDRLLLKLQAADGTS